MPLQHSCQNTHRQRLTYTFWSSLWVEGGCCYIRVLRVLSMLYSGGFWVTAKSTSGRALELRDMYKQPPTWLSAIPGPAFATVDGQGSEPPPRLSHATILLPTQKAPRQRLSSTVVLTTHRKPNTIKRQITMGLAERIHLALLCRTAS